MGSIFIFQLQINLIDQQVALYISHATISCTKLWPDQDSQNAPIAIISLFLPHGRVLLLMLQFPLFKLNAPKHSFCIPCWNEKIHVSITFIADYLIMIILLEEKWKSYSCFGHFIHGVVKWPHAIFLFSFFKFVSMIIYEMLAIHPDSSIN